MDGYAIFDPNKPPCFMKKLIFIIVALFMASSIFSSCEKDSTYENDLVGTWIAVSGTVTYENGDVDRYPDSNKLGFAKITFYDDGTYTTEGSVNDENYNTGIRFPYTIRDGIWYSMGIPQFKIVSLTKNKLVMEANSDMMGWINALMTAADEPKIVSLHAEFKRL